MDSIIDRNNYIYIPSFSLNKSKILYFSQLKKKWGVSSNFQLIIIFIVFGITGSTAAWISEPLCNIFGITTENLNIIIYWLVRIVLITIVYQFILIVVAFLFGELKFFWKFVRNFLNIFGLRC